MPITEERPTLFNPNLGDIDAFIETHKGMVYANAYRGKRKTRLPAELVDLRQEGYIGLIKAYMYFDPEKGMISTFAYKWINNEIKRYIRDRLPLVRSPRRSYELAGKIIMERLVDSSPEEIAEHYYTTVKKAKRALLMANNKISVSMNEKVDYGGKTGLEHIEMFSTEDDYTAAEVMQFLDKLTAQQRRVIILLMNGLKNADVARELGVSRSRIGAIVRSVEVRYVKYQRRCI